MKNEDIIAAARERLDEAISADQSNRDQAKDDLDKLAGDQWPEDVKSQRESEGRPCLTLNRLPGFARQVTGDIRKLNPAVKVLPADGAASPDVAETISGLVRHIEYRSAASSVYEGAAESAAQCGMGAFRVLHEYEDDDSFDQGILIRRIHNPFSVYWDPAAREATREDAKYCFITDQIREKDFREAFPDASLDDVTTGTNDGMENWHEGGKVVVAEYFWKEPYTVTLGLLADGRVIENPEAIHYAVKTRKSVKHKVMWAKVSGAEVLEGPVEYPCKHIPVIAVVGEEMHVGDEVKRTSVIRFAKDPQQLYNYWSSADAEFVALQPKAPYILTATQVSGYEKMWGEAHDKNRPYLVYNPDPKAPSAPQRSAPPMASAGMGQQALKAVEDMKAATGIYDAGLGNRSNEQSGVAIRQRQMESDVSNSIYTDNLAKSIEHCGRIVVDMIPRIYDTNRIVRIVGDDDQEQMVEINGQRLNPQGDGLEMINPLSIGKYDVRVSVGPNYSTRRQETQEGMMQFVQSFPQAGAVAGDLIAKAMDWPDADKLAERLKKTLPPGMIDPEDMSPEEQQQMQAGMQQQQQQMQQQRAAQEAEIRKSVAEADEAESQAMEARFEAMLKQLELVLAQAAPIMQPQAATAPQSAPQGYSPY